MENTSVKPSGSVFTPRFVLLLLAAGFFGLSFATFFLLPKFLAVELAADAATIGTVTSISWLASVVCVPFVGVQIDRHGRKLFASLGAVIFAVSCLGFLWVDSVGPLLWILRIVQGLSFTLFYVSLSTLATDISPPERLGQAIGVFGGIMISTNALGPAAAEWIAQHYSWTVVFACTACAAGMSATLTLFVREPRRVSPHENAASMLQVVARPGLKQVLIVAVMVGWTFGGAFTFYQPWALLNGFEQVSTFLIAYAVCAMLVRIALGGLGDRLGRMRVAKGAILLYVTAPFALIWLDYFGLLLTGGLLGLAHGVFHPALNAVAVGYALDSERGKAMGAYHGAFNIGFFAGSLLLGHVVMATSYPTIFSIAGVTCFAAFIVLMLTPKAMAQKASRSHQSMAVNRISSPK